MDNYQSVGQLRKPPLVYTAGFVFINLKNIDEYSAKIQDALRDDYPGHATVDVDVSEVTPLGERRSRTIRHYALNSPDLEWGMVITDQRFVFHTVNYKHFEDFGDRFAEAFSKFVKVTGLKYHSGLAYRQIDNFYPIDDEQYLSDCVNEKFLPVTLSESIKGNQSEFSRQEHRYVLEDNSALILRTYSFDKKGGPSIPEDLMPFYMSLDYSLLDRNYRQPPYVLADFEVNKILGQKSEGLDVGKLRSKLNEFHQYSSLVFREVIKPDALKRRR